MNLTKSRSLQWLSLILRQLYLVGTFCVPDLWLRYKTRAIGLYPITELAPNLLTLMWAVLLSSLVTLIPSRKWGRIAYGVVYYFYFIYTLVQFGVYLVLDRFVYVTDLVLAGEGADYARWVLEFVTPSLVCQLLALIGFGVLGILFFPKKPAAPGRVSLVRGLAALMAVIGISQAGMLYSEELSGLYAKARLTDEMFRLLLERLEADGKLEDTVIVCYGDHYAYGVQDTELLQQKSEEAGSPILEKTPAFVWWSGCEGVEIDKVCHTVDLAPAIMNLFGMEVPKNLMGSDILDDGYSGYAIFPYTTWVTGDCYVKYGEIQWNNGMTEEEIRRMNAFVQRYYYINDAILDADYYAEK